jgi:hypothetical protein
MLGDMLDGGTRSDLEDGGGTLAEVRFGRVIAENDQFRFLIGREANMMGARHRSILRGLSLSLQNPV